MDGEEFNLSVLENVTLLASPLKDSANYETILGLIKEEIDIINTEDETESQRGENHACLGRKRKNSECRDNSKDVFKSPSERKYALGVKSPGSLLKKRHTYEWQRNEKASFDINYRRVRSLGAIKPGRSFRSNGIKNRSFVSQSSETSGLTDFGDTVSTDVANLILGNGGNLENKAEERTRVREETAGTTAREAESVSLALGDSFSHAKSPENDFVCGSQTTTSSNLRKVLFDRRSTVEKKTIAAAKIIESDGKTGIAKTEDEEEETEEQNFSLIFSPRSKSRASSVNREASLTPPRPIKRKARVPSPIEGSTPKERKLESKMGTNPKSARTGPCNANSASPLKGLSRELENCITSSDYEQMSEDLKTDLLERTSFTFETIELFNQYEDANNQWANNQILSKILASPTAKIKEESWDGSSIVACKAIEPNEDPLYIEESEANFESSKSKIKSNFEKTKKSIVAKTRRRSTRKSLAKEETPSKFTLRKRSVEKANNGGTIKSNVIEKLKTPKRRTSLESLVSEKANDKSIVSSRSAAKRSTENMTDRSTKKSIEAKKTREDDEKRARGKRLGIKKLTKMNLSDLEDDEDLAVVAARVSRKIEAAEKKITPSRKIFEKLDHLVVRLRHEVLPQHKIATGAGSKPLTYEQQKSFVQFAPLNKQTYSPSEDETIKANWKAFCEDHSWNPENYKPFMYLRYGKKCIMANSEERRKFVQFLADGLPNRPLFSVYSRFKILYGKSCTAGLRYTGKEDMKILAYMLHKPAENPDKKYSELSRVLNRTRESIWRRYQKLLNNYCRENERKVLTKVEWDLSLAEKFITTLIDVTLSEDLMELKDAFIPKVVWQKMEKKMKIDHQLMKRFWEQQLHLQLFSVEPIYINKIKVMLIEHMHEKQMWYPEEIKWQHIVRYFDGLTASFLRKIFNHLTMETSVKIHSRNLKMILKWLYTKKIDQLTNEEIDKCLPRILYKDKKAKIFIEDAEKILSHAEKLEIKKLDD